MSDDSRSLQLNRRNFLGAASAGALLPLALGAGSRHFDQPADKRAQIAITFDLEMSRNFPKWEMTHWDYEKGNLNDETKRYSVEGARRVKQLGGRIHFFAVGRALEQADVSWLNELVDEGHPIGNHTYDHVNLTAAKSEDLQYRFQRAPWLLRGQSVAEAIRENIVMTNHALKERLGIAPAGFRTPGGFTNGLRDHEAIRGVLQELGFEWISSLYPSHPNTAPMQEPSKEVVEGIVAAQKLSQPFVYPGGLIEIPMSPISDIGAFRSGRWKLEWFLSLLRESVTWAIENRAVFDFLAHPSCLYVVDPEFRSIELICKLVQDSGGKAELVDLNKIAETVKQTPKVQD